MPENEDTKVFAVSVSGHDFTDATQWGRLIAVTDGYVNPSRPDHILYDILKKFVDEDLTDQDWLAPAGLVLLNILAAVAYYEQFGQLKLLLFDKKNHKKKLAGHSVNDYREIVITRDQIKLNLARLAELKKTA